MTRATKTSSLRGAQRRGNPDKNTTGLLRHFIPRKDWRWWLAAVAVLALLAIPTTVLAKVYVGDSEIGPAKIFVGDTQVCHMYVGAVQVYDGCAVPETMQSMTADYCKSMKTGDTIILADARNNFKYRVRKMADGKCWMVNNLAIAGGVGNSGTLTGINTNVGASPTFPVNIGTNSSILSFTAPGIRFDSTSYSPQSYDGTSFQSTYFGYYYSYVAAYARPGALAGYAVDPATSSNTIPASVCPAGWHLPVIYNDAAGGRVSEFDDLYTATSGDLNGGGFDFTNAGFWNGTQPGPTQDGYYYFWEANTGPDNFGQVVSFSVTNGSINHPAHPTFYQFPIRCILDTSEYYEVMPVTGLKFAYDGTDVKIDTTNIGNIRLNRQLFTYNTLYQNPAPNNSLDPGSTMIWTSYTSGSQGFTPANPSGGGIAELPPTDQYINQEASHEYSADIITAGQTDATKSAKVAVSACVGTYGGGSPACNENGVGYVGFYVIHATIGGTTYTIGYVVPGDNTVYSPCSGCYDATAKTITLPNISANFGAPSYTAGPNKLRMTNLRYGQIGHTY